MKKSGSWLGKFLAAKVLVLGVLMLGFTQLAWASCKNPITNNDGVDSSASYNYYGGFHNAPNYRNKGAFAALTSNGEIKVWGSDYSGGNQADAPTGTGYTKIYSTEYAFAALTADGQIRAWGTDAGIPPSGSGYTKIYSNSKAFAALTADGQIKVWGYDSYGGNQADAPTGTGYTKIYWWGTSFSGGFATLTPSGQIKTWPGSNAPAGTGYTRIYSNAGALAALTFDGQIRVWGSNNQGGNQAEAPTGSGYTKISSTRYAFATLTPDGRVKAWGDDTYGGNQADAPTGAGYTEIYSNEHAFAALTADGQIKVWGSEQYGGNQADAPTGSGYARVYSNGSAFAALTSDGQIKAWGSEYNGGNQADVPAGSGHTTIYSTSGAFAALTADGQIKVWGNDDEGGNQADVPTGSGYVEIYSTEMAFAALTADGEIKVWGHMYQGGNQNEAPSGTGNNIPYGGDLCDLNLPPYDITLTPDNIDENVSAGTEVGTLTTSDVEDDTYTYFFANGCVSGSSDNGSFTIAGDKIAINSSPDFETKPSYRLCVATDDGTDVFKKEITVNVNNLDEEPPVITVNGANPMTVNQGDPYIEQGATCTDDIDESCTVVIAGTVDTNTPGTYTITYNATDAAGNNAIEQTRTVNVVTGSDTTGPSLVEVAFVPTPTKDATPNYTFSSTENGTINYSGDCSSATTDAIAGDNTITFNELTEGFHSNCTITVTDADNNTSDPLSVTAFVVDLTSPAITLNGDNPMTLIKGETYTEPGATCADNFDSACTVTVGGDVVNTNTPGTYTVTYNAIDAAGNNAEEKTRTVKVLSEPDTIAPVITLNGDNPMTITQGETYTEPGATCLDNVDPDCSVVIGGDKVNSNKVGTYTVTYNAQDSSGNKAIEQTRTVNVVAAEEEIALSPIYRFWSDTQKAHFYTISKQEKDHVIKTYPDNVWRYEGVAYKASKDKADTVYPIYRFWSDTQKAHFYTISKQEKDHVIKTYPDNVWRYEGIAWYSEKKKNDKNQPLYRFWSDTQKAHFYTISKQEKDHVIKTYPDNVWRYEGVAWYGRK